MGPLINWIKVFLVYSELIKNTSVFLPLRPIILFACNMVKPINVFFLGVLDWNLLDLGAAKSPLLVMNCCFLSCIRLRYISCFDWTEMLLSLPKCSNVFTPQGFVFLDIYDLGEYNPFLLKIKQPHDFQVNLLLPCFVYWNNVQLWAL